MIPPELAAQRLLYSFLIGAALGPCMAFLSPLRRHCPVLYQLLVCASLLPAWLSLTFAVCGGDIGISAVAVAPAPEGRRPFPAFLAWMRQGLPQVDPARTHFI